MTDPMIKLYCVYLNQDDPKKNTVMKLVKQQKVIMKKKIYHCPRNAIILDPFAHQPITNEDRINVQSSGIVVIDCSWEQTETIFQKGFKSGRCLPHLLAANTVNYGRWDRLSSAEALAAALYLTGFHDQSHNTLSNFTWGEEFFRINKLD